MREGLDHENMKKDESHEKYLGLAPCYLVAGPFALFVSFVAIVVQTPSL